MVNDRAEPARGTLRLTLSGGGKELAAVQKAYDIPGLGQQSYALDLEIPAFAGECLLRAEAGGTLSRRKVMLTKP